MAIELALRAYLLAQSGVTDLVDERVYPPDGLPQSPTYPCLSYRVISLESAYSTLAATGNVTCRIQIDAFSQSYTGMLEVCEALRNALSGFRGSWGGTFVESVFKDNEIDLPFQPIDASQSRVFRRSTDWMIAFQESIPTL